MAFNLEIELTRLERLVGSQTREIERTRQEELTGKQTLEKLRRAQVPPSLGTRYVQMDSKGRIVLAAPVRRSLGTPIIATRAARRSILLLPAPLWATILNDLDGDACDFYASGAFGLIPDGRAGRVVVPDALRRWAQLTLRCEMAVVGLGAFVLLCRADTWDAHLGELEQRLLKGEG